MDEFRPELRELIARFQAEREVVIGTSPDVTVPTAVGLFKPAILLPEWALTEIPAEELKVILWHEFAHLQRRDDWTNLTQKLLRTLFFFHPAVWWIEKRLCLERELACDDVVLAKTQNPRGYAECLVSLLEKRVSHQGIGRRGVALAQAAIGHARQISIRLAQILDGRRAADTRWLGPVFAVVTVFAGISLVVMPAMPKLVGFTTGVAVARIPVAQRASIPVVQQMSAGVSQTGVVPASLKVDTQNRSLERRKHRQVAIDDSTRLAASGPPRIRKAENPVVMPASLKRPMAAPQFLVITQTTEYSASGIIRNSLCVWRVTVTGSQQQPLSAELIVQEI
jgi:hypothetical protein